MEAEQKQFKNHKEVMITYKRHKIDSGRSIEFFSFPWSYFVTGFMFFLIGLLDFFLLGYHIGHPHELIIGTPVGQGTAVFLGGISFFYTVGLMPLITGLIIILYCIFATKKVILSNTVSSYVVQVMKPLFPTVTHINKDIITRKLYTNTGLQLRHIWVLIFIPMGIRVLQFGIPLFGEHMAQDEILPTMMLLTGLIDILGALLMLIIPSQTLKFESEDKEYSINFFVNKTSHIQELMNSSPKTQKPKIDLVKLIPGIVLIFLSMVGFAFEYLWGTDLCMVSITFGILLILKTIQNSQSFSYFSIDNNLNREEYSLRKLSFIEVLGIGLLIYLSTIEFVWTWIFLTNTTAVIICDLVISSVLWVGLLFWICVYLFVPYSAGLNFKNIKNYWNSGRSNRLNIIFRIILFVISLGLTLLKLI